MTTRDADLLASAKELRDYGSACMSLDPAKGGACGKCVWCRFVAAVDVAERTEPAAVEPASPTERERADATQREYWLRERLAVTAALLAEARAAHPAAPPVPETLREWCAELVAAARFHTHSPLVAVPGRMSETDLDAIIARVGPSPVDTAALDAARVEGAAHMHARWLAHANKLRAFYERLGNDEPSSVMIGAQGGLDRLVREETGEPPHPEADAYEARVRAAERERCAKVCDRDRGSPCADWIRALGPTPAEAPAPSVAEEIVAMLRERAAELLNARNGSHPGGPHWQRFNYAVDLVTDLADAIEQKHGARR